VGFRVVLRRFFGVGLRMNSVTMRGVRVVRSRLVIAGFVVPGRFVVMLRGRLVVLRGFQVVFRALMFRHCHLLS
jgi:hypothetical protein